MKQFLILLFYISICTGLSATDPIKKRTYFIEFDLAYPFYHHYNQILFQKKGLGLGGALSLGHHSFPLYLEYFHQTPLLFSYRNNEVRDAYQELGVRYNVNHLTYLIPYGVNPYVGLGLMRRTSEFKQYSLTEENSTDLLNSVSQQIITYKLSGGLKVGNRNVTLGLHYDYLPGAINIPNPETENLTIYNSMHVFSVRLGIRLSKIPGRKIKCPRFNTKQKRTLRF